MTAYVGLSDEYAHVVIDHAEKYVDGRVHANGIETYVSVDPSHLFRYSDERVFTYNERENTDYGRFAKVLRAAVGCRLTYAELTS